MMNASPPTARPLIALCALLSTIAASGCGSGDHPKPTTPAPSNVVPMNSGLAAERWFPLVQGNVYQYVTRASDGAEGMLITTAQRSGRTTGALRTGSRDKTFQFVADGVKKLDAQGAAYVLKTPLVKGASWRGEHGGMVTVRAVNSSVVVPAGSYTGCAVTEEQRAGDVPLIVATTFCPDVGIVLLEAHSGGRKERAELKSYGPPMNLGPDGVRRIP